MLATPERWFLMKENNPEPELPHLLSRMTPVDLVLVEGFKTASIKQIEVHRSVLAQPLLTNQHGQILATASDVAALACDRPLLPLQYPEAIASFIADHFSLKRN